MKMNPAGDVLLTLGTRGRRQLGRGGGNTRLLIEPADIAFGPGGDVFVVQGHGRGEGRVLRFDKTGKFLKSWGGKGAAPGQFDQPHSILVDAQNQVYVADRENRRVQIFDTDGRFIKSWKFAGLPCGCSSGPISRCISPPASQGQFCRLTTANGKAVAAMGQPGKGARRVRRGALHGDRAEQRYLRCRHDQRVLHRYTKG